MNRSRLSRSNVRKGDDAQEIIGHRLRFHGLKMVARIETGFKIVRTAGRITGAYPISKVAADWTAIVPGTGQSVRCEVKARRDDQLSLSDFEVHQIRDLEEHGQLGGLSLVGFVGSASVAILRWPIAGFLIGKPLNVGDDRYLAALWVGVNPQKAPRVAG